jgi:hypothetical protein
MLILVATIASSSLVAPHHAAAFQLSRSSRPSAAMMSVASQDDVGGLTAESLLLLLANRRAAEEAKEAALQELQQAPADQRERLLDEAVELIRSAPASSILASRRWPLPLPSRRAALGSYARLLDSMMAEEPGGGARFTDGGDTAKERRFVGVLLRQLRRGKGGVWSLEREAAKRRKDETSMEEMLRRTPEDLETPAYEVVAANRPGGWEVRKYAEFAVATTRRDRAVAASGVQIQQPSMPAAGGFQALAGYILGGRNVQEEKMAMTTPVLNSAATGEMSFVLPSKYWTPESEGGVAPPTPLPESGVQIKSKGGGALEQSPELACLWFGGFAGSDEVARRKAMLLEAVAADGEWEAACGSDDEAELESSIVLMQYNDPFTPPWQRRNEVAIPVRQRA